MDFIAQRVAAVRDATEARAVGYWELQGVTLSLRAFLPSEEMDIEVSRAFAEATRNLGLDRSDLSVVQAWNTGHAVVANAADQEGLLGSGHWLRSFGAVCSIAVPLHDDLGRVIAVLSVALDNLPSDTREMVEFIRRRGQEFVSQRDHI